MPSSWACIRSPCLTGHPSATFSMPDCCPLVFHHSGRNRSASLAGGVGHRRPPPPISLPDHDPALPPSSDTPPDSSACRIAPDTFRICDGRPIRDHGPTAGYIGRYLAVPDPTSVSAPELKRLTERESQVLGLVAAGLSNNAIGEWLHVSPLTAKTHVNHIMSKLGARDRAQLVVIAYQSGFAIPGRRVGT
ncbi:helix-turn-helix transcriptional regulator [Streptomyces sporangiiformans]|uniref:Helix-turn-helix transcriptional regulator n=1 Tax=Streptomyces sporangiiformans TaxID=2315329 RepID=A0A505DF31_9ACTN|nr:helix-turn-helix transcriptional regulator [Streptomyces sporangiiformans]